MIDLIHFNPGDPSSIRYRGSIWGLVSLEVSMVWKVSNRSVRKADSNLTLAVL